MTNVARAVLNAGKDGVPTREEAMNHAVSIDKAVGWPVKASLPSRNGLYILITTDEQRAEAFAKPREVLDRQVGYRVQELKSAANLEDTRLAIENAEKVHLDKISKLSDRIRRR